MLNFFERFVRALTTRTAQVAQVALVFAMAVIMGNIILREVWKPIGGTHELVEMAGAVLLALGVAYTAMLKGHIAVGVLVEKFSPRIQAVVDILVTGTALYFTFILSREMFVYAARSAERGWTTGHLFIPLAPSIYLVAFGMIMVALVLLLDLIKAVLTVIAAPRIDAKGSESG
jgi:TRAP-type C4-dicarboxylate transport system permease small subunit